MRKLAVTGFFFLLVSCAFAQDAFKAEDFKAALMQTKTGAKLVYNGDKHSFSVDIVGEVKPNDQPDFITVNGKILQLSIIPFQVKVDFVNMSQESQKKNLGNYMDYEMNYIKEQLKAKNLNVRSEFMDLGGKVFLYWSYDMPKSYKSVHTQCYLVTICFDHMFIINSALPKDVSEEETKKLMTAIGNSLRLNNNPTDLNKLYEELNAK